MSDMVEAVGMSDTDMVEAVAVEQAVMVCPQCEGEGGYADGLDEAACHTECTRCGGNGWIVDRAALSVIEGRVKAEERERAARIAEGKYRDHPAASVRAVNYRHAARVIAAAIRSGDEG